MTYEKDTSGQVDNATTDEVKQQHDSDELRHSRMEVEGNPVRRLHYGVGQLQSPLRCDPAHDGQK